MDIFFLCYRQQRMHTRCPALSETRSTYMRNMKQCFQATVGFSAWSERIKNSSTLVQVIVVCLKWMHSLIGMDLNTGTDLIVLLFCMAFLFLVPVVFLFCVALWFILCGVSCFKVFPCSLSSCFVIPFSIVINSLGEEEAGLCTSRAIIFLLCTC